MKLIELDIQKFGGRGASSSIAKQKPKSQLVNEYNKLRRENTSLYNEYNGFALTTSDRKEISKIESAKKKWNRNRQQMSKLSDEINKRDNESFQKSIREHRKSGEKINLDTFVNSYGEATKREITNSTYKRQQSRVQKQIRRNMGY